MKHKRVHTPHLLCGGSKLSLQGGHPLQSHPKPLTYLTNTPREHTESQSTGTTGQYVAYLQLRNEKVTGKENRINQNK